jgi:hypothetical protein
LGHITNPGIDGNPGFLYWDWKLIGNINFWQGYFSHRGIPHNIAKPTAIPSGCRTIPFQERLVDLTAVLLVRFKYQMRPDIYW